MHALRVRGIYGSLVRHHLTQAGICHLSERFAARGFAGEDDGRTSDRSSSFAIRKPITSFSLAKCGKPKGRDLGDLARDRKQSGRVALLEFKFNFADRCSRVAAFNLSTIDTDFNFALLPGDNYGASPHMRLEHRSKLLPDFFLRQHRSKRSST